MKNKRRIIIFLSATILLLIPLIAMQFDSGVNWSGGDFIIMALLLYGTGFLCELVMSKVKNSKNRIFICALVLLMFFLVWIELAVGIFGSPFAGS